MAIKIFSSNYYYSAEYSDKKVRNVCGCSTGDPKGNELSLFFYDLYRVVFIGLFFINRESLIFRFWLLIGLSKSILYNKLNNQNYPSVFLVLHI